MSISEQVRELREFAKNFSEWEYNRFYDTISRAADTIESLSAKLQTKEYCDGCPGADIIEIPCTEECKRRHFKAENMQRSAEDCGGGWIPCKERLPEEKINPVTDDFYEYEVTFKQGDVIDIRHYKFGRGHWWNYGMLSDDCVIAWREHLEPYHEP